MVFCSSRTWYSFRSTFLQIYKNAQISPYINFKSSAIRQASREIFTSNFLPIPTNCIYADKKLLLSEMMIAAFFSDGAILEKMQWFNEPE